MLSICRVCRPGRRGRLPARTPLRTVRESFPSYGSSLHKVRAWPIGPARLTRPTSLTPLGNTGLRSFWSCCLGQQLRDASADRRRPSFAFLGASDSTGVLAISDRTDVGLSSALPLALASSVFPKLRPLTRLAVRSARSRGRTGLAVFPCSANSTG